MAKNPAELTSDKLTKQAKKNILIVIVAGIVLIFADLIVSMPAGNIELVESSGKLYMIRPSEDAETGHIYLKAEIETEEGIVEKDVVIRLNPYSVNKDKDKKEDEKSEVSKEEIIDYEIRFIADSFNKDESIKQVELPGTLESGNKITWKKDPQNNTVAILICVVILILIIYIKRMEPLKKQQQIRNDSVMRNLPEFVNRLVLLLGAGMVLNSAFEKTIEEVIAFREENDYFTDRMEEIYIAVKNTNGIMHHELRRFAKESGTKELMRISNIINDNINKGVELTQKLQNENELLWIARKKNCEERGRIAETKMTLPLVLFLIVLIVIVVSPALLEL